MAPGCAALSFDCTGSLYAVTGANAAGEIFQLANSLVRLDSGTSAATGVCTFTSTDLIAVGAFLDGSTFAHFYGTAPPVMEILPVSRDQLEQTDTCRTT